MPSHKDIIEEIFEEYEGDGRAAALEMLKLSTSLIASAAASLADANDTDRHLMAHDMLIAQRKIVMELLTECSPLKMSMN